MIDPVQVEPRKRDLTPGTSAVCAQLPQLFRIADISSKSAAHANDGDGHSGIHGGHWYGAVSDLSLLAAANNLRKYQIYNLAEIGSA
jgi:hypothetical protein